MMSLIARKLPKSKVDQIAQKISSLTDKNEDLSTISKKVDYGTKVSIMILNDNLIEIVLMD